MTVRLKPSGMLPTLQHLLSIVVIAMFIMTFVVQPFRIPSESMLPTLLVGDFLMVNKQAFSSHGILDPLPRRAVGRGDIIVFYYPVDPTLHLVKRVIGLPGDRVHLHGNRVFINGAPIADPYAFYRPEPADRFRDEFPDLERADPSVNTRWWIQMRGLLEHGEITVPAGEYFVLGDNRNDSEDSRYWGFVPAANIVGQPLMVYFSLRQPDAGRAAGEPERQLGVLERMTDALDRMARWDRVGKVLR